MDSKSIADDEEQLDYESYVSPDKTNIEDNEYMVIIQCSLNHKNHIP